MDRRSLLKFMLATAAAEAVDFEQLLWMPKSIITVPAMPRPVIVMYHMFDTTGKLDMSKYLWKQLDPKDIEQVETFEPTWRRTLRDRFHK